VARHPSGTATAQCAAVLEREFRTNTKISCEAVLAEIFETHKARKTGAVHLKKCPSGSLTHFWWTCAFTPKPHAHCPVAAR
jgi:hypothetical protein